MRLASQMSLVSRLGVRWAGVIFPVCVCARNPLGGALKGNRNFFYEQLNKNRNDKHNSSTDNTIDTGYTHTHNTTLT